MKHRLFFLLFTLLILITSAHAATIRIKASKRYLNLPVSHAVQREIMTIEANGMTVRSFEIRLAPENPDYWVFCDISAFKDETLSITVPSSGMGLSHVFQSDTIVGQDSLYHEQHRPQYHFSSRRGWNNDPNGLVYHDGEYHLFYQHNPYEREWGNMHWGHAVSDDLMHWKELPIALYPDAHGTMFSGSVVIDSANTAGFNKDNRVAMVALYTADSPDRQVQCVAYSLDRGRTWKKYEHNPVIDSKEKWNSKDTRDPKVFWYEPDSKWVMVLNERDGHSIYNSTDLKEWHYQSHITGFWECPELFELPVDKDQNRKKWVMYGASGTYMIGDFDGEVFTPVSGKHFYTTGTGYAGQTFNHIPAADGRRIQISWGRVSAGAMPFNMLMLLPVELTLRSTREGVRLFSEPVAEVDLLTDKKRTGSDMGAEEANSVINEFRNESLLHIRFTISLSHATGAGLDYHGQTLLNYDLNFNTVNGVFYSPEDMTSMEITADIFIDKTSVEVFIDNGAYSTSFERKTSDREKGFSFWGNNIRIRHLEISTMQSIWK